VKSKYDEDRAILLAVTGSRAYGLSHEGSDTDYIGVWVAPMHEVLGFTDVNASYHFDNEDDLHVHELGKFMSLVMKGNPTVTELLWLDEYFIKTELGQGLVNQRLAMMGAENILNAYTGYAMAQVKRCSREGDIQRRTKHLRHCFRLLLQAEQLLTTGELTVRLTDEQAADVREMSTREDFETQFRGREVACQRAYETTSLQLQPDPDLINDFLVWARVSSAVVV
jgi:hypothetical protein